MLNVFRTLKEDVGVVRRLLLPLPSNNNFLSALVVSVGKVLADNVESVRREMWEERNGAEVLEGLRRFFHNNHTHFHSFHADLVKHNLSKVLIGNEDNTTINYYLSVGEVLLRVGAFVEYLHLRVTSPFAAHNKNILKLGEALKPCRVPTPTAMKLNNALLTKEIQTEFKLKWDDVNVGEFRRVGVLLKLCRRRGLQNRLFFLFRDVFGYGTRVSSAGGFRLHGLLRTSELEVETNSHVDMVPHSFVVNVLAGNKVLVLAAFNDTDKKGWVEDLRHCIAKTDRSNTNSAAAAAVSSSAAYCSSTEEIEDSINHVQQPPPPIVVPLQHHRANSVLHVCWHRNLTVTHTRIATARNCQLSGYLLRKFKNSPGWQRLWVVYANVCLYFYKSHSHHDNNEEEEEEGASSSTPLASLPLLGYRVGVPSEEDGIRKDHVFKLSFKNHVYFFRADSQFTFLRWKHILAISTHP